MESEPWSAADSPAWALEVGGGSGGWQGRQVLSADVQSQEENPISNAPSPAPTAFPLLSEIDGATFPVTPDEERRAYSAPH